MIDSLQRYFKGADFPAQFSLAPELSNDAGYFQFGEGNICYGRSSAGSRSPGTDGPLYDVSGDIVSKGNTVRLPLDPDEIAENLRNERYLSSQGFRNSGTDRLWVRKLYYLLRPAMPLAIRKHFQKIHLRGWQNIPFPSWPVDRTVDICFEKLMLLALNSGKKRIPFIWFWPEGANACAIMTHDVEEEIGRQFCSTLMDINDEFHVPASFQIVPEKRYQVPREYLDEIRQRGFEINVQDLNHDGRLFSKYEEFVRRAAKINHYAEEYGAKGFRAAILYRKQDWYSLLNFEYDMSVPNVAHLDPQRGGCCTVMPYFIGSMLELPVTTTQDHTLFNILNDFSLELWEKQIQLILQQHGLMNFIVHPDYIIRERPQTAYKALLERLHRLRAENNVWIALPGDVNRWWRQRDQMKLIFKEGEWSVEGPGSERACVAYATLQDDRISYEVESFSSETALNIQKSI